MINEFDMNCDASKENERLISIGDRILKEGVEFKSDKFSAPCNDRLTLEEAYCIGMYEEEKKKTQVDKNDIGLGLYRYGNSHFFVENVKADGTINGIFMNRADDGCIILGKKTGTVVEIMGTGGCYKLSEDGMPRDLVHELEEILVLDTQVAGSYDISDSSRIIPDIDKIPTNRNVLYLSNETRGLKKYEYYKFVKSINDAYKEKFGVEIEKLKRKYCGKYVLFYPSDNKDTQYYMRVDDIGIYEYDNQKFVPCFRTSGYTMLIERRRNRISLLSPTKFSGYHYGGKVSLVGEFNAANMEKHIDSLLKSVEEFYGNYKC